MNLELTTLHRIGQGAPCGGEIYKATCPIVSTFRQLEKAVERLTGDVDDMVRA